MTNQMLTREPKVGHVVKTIFGERTGTVIEISACPKSMNPDVGPYYLIEFEIDPRRGWAKVTTAWMTIDELCHDL